MSRGVVKSPATIVAVSFAGAGALLASLAFPPAFWLFGVGVVLIVVAAIVNGRRTGVWLHTPWLASDREYLPPLEFVLGAAGILLMVIPLAVAALRLLHGV